MKKIKKEDCKHTKTRKEQWIKDYPNMWREVCECGYIVKYWRKKNATK